MNIMKSIAFLFVFVALSGAAVAQKAEQELPAVDNSAQAEVEIQPAPAATEAMEIKRLPRIKVVITGLAPETGKVEISLFNSAETFMIEPLYQESKVPNLEGRVKMQFLNVFEGEYAVVVVHDENDNGLYDAGFLGFGAEPVGYSNNIRPFLGRPSFKEVSFSVVEDTEIAIEMD